LGKGVGWLPIDMATTTRTIGIFGFDGVTALDLTGPADVFATASGIARQDGLAAPYRTVVLGLTARPFRSDSGLVMRPDCALGRAPALDTLVIPGGEGLRRAATNQPLTGWLRARAPGVRRIVSVCTGIYGLAPSGLLESPRTGGSRGTWPSSSRA
jgi:transcriptional regulator GlxA family with amidase domain